MNVLFRFQEFVEMLVEFSIQLMILVLLLLDQKLIL